MMVETPEIVIRAVPEGSANYRGELTREDLRAVLKAFNEIPPIGRKGWVMSTPKLVLEGKIEDIIIIFFDLDFEGDKEEVIHKLRDKMPDNLMLRSFKDILKNGTNALIGFHDGEKTVDEIAELWETRSVEYFKQTGIKIPAYVYHRRLGTKVFVTVPDKISKESLEAAMRYIFESVRWFDI